MRGICMVTASMEKSFMKQDSMEMMILSYLVMLMVLLRVNRYSTLVMVTIKFKWEKITGIHSDMEVEEKIQFTCQVQWQIGAVHF